MKASHVKSGVLVYLDARELEHLGGIGRPVDIDFNEKTWLIRPDTQATRRIVAETANKTRPGRIIITDRKKLKNLPMFSATEWETEAQPDGTLVAFVGKMGGLNTRTRNGLGSKAKPSAERVKPEVRAERPAQKSAPAPTISLGEAIDAVNAHKDLCGDELVLEITGDGYLLGLIQYGRKENRK